MAQWTRKQRRAFVWGVCLSGFFLLSWLASYDARFNPFADRYPPNIPFKVHTGRGCLWLKPLSAQGPAYPRGDYGHDIAIPLWLPAILVAGVAVWSIWKYCPIPARGHCYSCGYNLTGLETPRCPECGRTLRQIDGRMCDPDEAA